MEKELKARLITKNMACSMRIVLAKGGRAIPETKGDLKNAADSILIRRVWVGFNFTHVLNFLAVFFLVIGEK
ncbi:MAG: hypothetical protein MI784_12220 [Cytophagales bacterium]|nr:hypothetical protein [Cytophagales bacterium]